jgi:hypothetical protein
VSDHEEKQRRYAAKRPKLAEPKYSTREYRVTLPDGSERIERVIGLSQIAAYWPDAIRVELVEAVGGFW